MRLVVASGEGGSFVAVVIERARFRTFSLLSLPLFAPCCFAQVVPCTCIARCSRALREAATLVHQEQLEEKKKKKVTAKQVSIIDYLTMQSMQAISDAMDTSSEDTDEELYLPFVAMPSDLMMTDRARWYYAPDEKTFHATRATKDTFDTLLRAAHRADSAAAAAAAAANEDIYDEMVQVTAAFNKQVMLPRAVLCAASPVFAQLLRRPSTSRICINGVLADELHTLRAYLTCQPLSAKALFSERVVLLADHFELHELFWMATISGACLKTDLRSLVVKYFTALRLSHRPFPSLFWTHLVSAVAFFMRAAHDENEEQRWEGDDIDGWPLLFTRNRLNRSIERASRRKRYCANWVRAEHPQFREQLLRDVAKRKGVPDAIRHEKCDLWDVLAAHGMLQRVLQVVLRMRGPAEVLKVCLDRLFPEMAQARVHNILLWLGIRDAPADGESPEPLYIFDDWRRLIRNEANFGGFNDEDGTVDSDGMRPSRSLVVPFDALVGRIKFSANAMALPMAVTRVAIFYQHVFFVSFHWQLSANHAALSLKLEHAAPLCTRNVRLQLVVYVESKCVCGGDTAPDTVLNVDIDGGLRTFWFETMITELPCVFSRFSEDQLMPFLQKHDHQCGLDVALSFRQLKE